MNIIENLKKESEHLAYRIDSIQKANDFLFEEHASIVKHMNDSMKESLKDSSLAKKCNDTMDFLFYKSEKIMDTIHENNALVREYQYILHHLNETISKLEDDPSSLELVLGLLCKVLHDLVKENERYSSDSSISFAILQANNEIEMIRFYVQIAVTECNPFVQMKERKNK